MQPNTQYMRIVHLSDTHNRHHQLPDMPEADLVVHYDTDILVTHQPPYGVLDFSENIHYGDHLLLQTVLDTRPRYHLFGHIHDAYGVEKGKSTIFSNASLLDEEYRLMNKPFVFEL